MKFGIIIQDLEADQAFDVLEKLGGLQTYRNIPATASVIESNTTGGNEGEFDSKGFPWDERIHAGTKSKNSDGQWKKKKGADEATIAAVEAELKGNSVIPSGNVPQAPVGYAAPVAAPTVAPAPVAPMVNLAPSVTPAPVAAPVAVAAPIQRDFKGLMQHISNLFQAKAIMPNYPDTIVGRINDGFKIQIATITDIATDPKYVEYAWQCVDVDGKGLAA